MKEIVDEADEARLLAAEMNYPASIDLLKYAAALETEAARMGAETSAEGAYDAYRPAA